MSEKEKITEQSYYVPSGYGSVQKHLADARKADPTITMSDIQNWRKKNLEQKTTYKGYNSFIASDAFEEFQADLAFFTDLQNSKYIGMLVVIDILTKYATCVPIRNKQPDEILNAFRIAAVKMFGKPKTYYTDDEGSFNSKQVQKYFEESKIRHFNHTHTRRRSREGH